MQPHARALRGLTIIEALLAMTILASTFLALTYTVVAGQQAVHEGDEHIRGTRLAEDLMEEIVGRAYRDPGPSPRLGPEPDEVGRTTFDDIDDYAAYSEPAGQLVDASGRPYGVAEQAFGRTVAVAPTRQSIDPLGFTASGLTVTVTVRNPQGEQWQFTRFISEPLKP